MLQELKILRKNHEDTNPFACKLSKYCVHSVSEDNFPTAAERAFTTAGFAALVRPIADLYELPQLLMELSKVARQGSGSGCRWLFGGYVAWEMGQAVDGSDSYAAEVAPASHWPDMKSVNLATPAAKMMICYSVCMQAIS